MMNQLTELKIQARAAAENMGHTLRGWALPEAGSALHANVCAKCARAAIVDMDAGTVTGLAVVVACRSGESE
jgi:hypothetical protein